MNKYSGSNFDDFLKEEGILEEVSALAQKRLEKPDNTHGFIGRFLQSIQFNNQLALRAASVCVIIAIGVYLGNRFFYESTPDFYESTPDNVKKYSESMTRENMVGPEQVEPTLVKGQNKVVRVSPFGFGAFPKIPADFPDQNIWDVIQKRSTHTPEETKKLELLARVRIKLWNQGKRTKGVIMDPSSGLIYLDSNVEILPDDRPDDIVSFAVPKYNTYFDEGFSPSGGIVVFLERGIDPYEFLNLRR